MTAPPPPDPRRPERRDGTTPAFTSSAPRGAIGPAGPPPRGGCLRGCLTLLGFAAIGFLVVLAALLVFGAIT
jgi:hypothetical protein